jgi:hypothetical protein
MNDQPEKPYFPEGVGPHEERELELMLAGKKPMAMFYEAVVLPVSDSYPEEEFMPYVETGILVRRDEIYQPHNHPMAVHYVYYALPGEEWRMDEMHTLQLKSHAGEPWTEDDEKKTGFLLGYSEDNVKAWLEWTRGKFHFSSN